MRQLFIIIVSIMSLIASERCCACLWDYDTLAMERQRFPEAQELIAGHFVRHSDTYYEWRILDRTVRPLEQRTSADFDDIAVAYDKLGQQDKAIEMIHAKIVRWPNERRYESEANLGTFYVHAGRFEEGLQHINRALELNPEAHFGREIYQKLLVEYVIESRRRAAQVPQDNEPDRQDGFAAFVLDSRKPIQEEKLAEIQDAVQGILGMMRFGRHDSPILLDALGDLLLVDTWTREDSKMLAARAYLKASYEVDDVVASAAYRKKAEQALELQAERELAEIESDLKSEIEQGDNLFRQISTDEQAWVAAGSNLDTEFASKYYKEPSLQVKRPDWHPTDPVERAVMTFFVSFAILLVAGVLVVRIMIRKWKRKQEATAK